MRLMGKWNCRCQPAQWNITRYCSDSGIRGCVGWREFNKLIRIQVVFVVFSFSSNSGRRIADTPFWKVLSISTTVRYMNKLNGFAWENSLPLSVTTIARGWHVKPPIHWSLLELWTESKWLRRAEAMRNLVFCQYVVGRKLISLEDVFHLHYIKLQGCYHWVGPVGEHISMSFSHFNAQQ